MTGALASKGLERFDEISRAHVARDRDPGRVALVAHGDDVHVVERGALSIGGAPVRRDTLFRIASVTKPITGAATLALVEEGLFTLDEPVDRLLPELADRKVLRRWDGSLDDTVPAARPSTVRDLLTFTLGFGMNVAMFMSPEPWPVVAAAAELHLATLGPPQPLEQPDPDTWIARFGTLPLMAQPGERWLYNTGALVLGVLLARAAQMSFADVLRTRVFEPLGMRDTAFFAPDTSRLATAYEPSGDGFSVWDAPDGQWSAPPVFGDGGAGLVSTADDLLAFSQMLLRRGAPVLSPDAVADMTRDHLTAAQATDAVGFLDGQSWGYCQGIVTSGPHAGAFGWSGGLGSSWMVDPAKDLVVIALTQRLFDSSNGPQLHLDLQAAAYEAVGAA